jgi:hypothetical protein
MRPSDSSTEAGTSQIVEGQLYKKGISQPMLKCITEAEGIKILHEVHSGTCGSHSGPRALRAPRGGGVNR